MAAPYPDPELPIAMRGVANPAALSASVRPTASWQAIFAGGAITLGIEALLVVLGTAVAVTVGGAQAPGAAGLGLGIWWIIATIIALFVGGYAAARLANVPARWDGMLHGLAVWGLAVLVGVWMIMAVAGTVITGAGTVLGGTISGLGKALGAAVPSAAHVVGGTNQIQNEAHILLAPPAPGPANMSPQQAEAAIAEALPALAQGGPQAAQARSQIIAILSARLNISPEEASHRLDQAQQALANAAHEAGATAQNVAQTGIAVASGAAWGLFVVLIVSGIAGGVGGLMARPRRIIRADRLQPLP